MLVQFNHSYAFQRVDGGRRVVHFRAVEVHAKPPDSPPPFQNHAHDPLLDMDGMVWHQLVYRSEFF
jgi:hypothetical protein